LGLFSKKSPEKELVDELVGSGVVSSDNLRKVLDDPVAMAELKEIVQKAWKNGASLGEILKVYDDNLRRLRSSSQGIEDSLNLENEGVEVDSLNHEKDDVEIKHPLNEKEEYFPLSSHDKLKLLIASLAIIALVVGGIYSIFFMQYTYTSFNEFEIDGVSFNIPSDYKLSTSGEDEDTFYNGYFTTYTSSSRGSSRTTNIYIRIFVYKNKSVQQVVSSISSEGWDVHEASYGNYSGYRLEQFLFEGCWFIFEKDGKTVAFYCERKAIKDNIERIIS